MKDASLENAEALYNLGGNYFFGNSLVPQNYSKATQMLEQYLTQTGDEAEAMALWMLGRCYVFGDEQNLPKAEMLFMKAAALGHKQAASDRDALQLGGSILDVR